MDSTLLIHAIVRQTMVLVAQLATSAGRRARLAHLANQIFMELVRELEGQGLGRKVIADMFGLGLRSYHAKVRRLGQSATEQEYSLWEAILRFVQEHGTVSRSNIIAHFKSDEELMIRGVLADLTDSGLVFRSGRAESTTYRAASAEDIGVLPEHDPQAKLAALLWVALCQSPRQTAEDLAETLGRPVEEMIPALEQLVTDGSIERSDDEPPTYSSEQCVIPVGDAVGWEAGVFDHYQAMVAGICAKLSHGARSSSHSDRIGGSTYTFDVWPGHPYYEEALGMLGELRVRASDLRQRVDAHNARASQPGDFTKVRFYFGQNVLDDEPVGSEEIS